jgi:AcrR family transcriptional regulator
LIKATAQTIVNAALETLREEGFAGASSRAIARRGGFNQALIFYHFGSVEALLLAALRQLGEERLARYREVVTPIESFDELVPAMADLWAEDEAAGHVRVVAQVIAGSANRPELSRQVVEQMEPWIELARETLARTLPPGLPVSDAAYGIVVWYVGANLMAHLDPEATRTEALFARAREWAPLLEAIFAGLGDESA